MDWLTQNWIWVVVAVGVAFYLFGRNLGGANRPGADFRHKVSGQPVAATADARPHRHGGCC